MGNPICEKCKPAEGEKVEAKVEKMECVDLYRKMDECMKLHKGNIASCKEEWTAFKICFKEKK